MNVWYFHHYATPQSISGLHRPYEFGKYFVKEGHKLTVFASSYLHYADENIITDNKKYCKKTYDGIDAIYIKTNGYKGSGTKRVINMFAFYKGLKKTIKSLVKSGVEKPDVIIASSPHPLTMMAGNSIAKKLGVPCICEVRDFWPEVFFLGGRLKKNGLLGKFLLKQEKKIYTKCTSLVFLKEGDHNYIKENKWDKESGGPIPMSKCYYVNNGVDIESFDVKTKQESFNDEHLDSNKKTIIYCGTIRPINNVEILVDVAKYLDEDTQILIYGSGSCEDKIRQRIKEEGVKNVFLKGYIQNQKVPYVLSKSTLNILNYSGKNYNWSRGNSSNKLFEYLASGKPVLSTVKMGYDILERYDCGVSDEEGTAESIAKKILEIVNLPKEEYETKCKNARKAAINFDIKNLSKDYLSVISKTIENFKTNN